MWPLILWQNRILGAGLLAGALVLWAYHAGVTHERERVQVRIAQLVAQRTLATARAVAQAEVIARMAADRATEAEGIARDVEAQPVRDCVCLSADVVRRLNRP